MSWRLIRVVRWWGIRRALAVDSFGGGIPGLGTGLGFFLFLGEALTT